MDTRSTGMLHRNIVVAATATLLLGLLDTASARPIRINFSFEDFAGSGEDWSSSSTTGDLVNLTADDSFGADLPFDLSIGSSSYNQYCISRSGSIWFGTGGLDCGAGPTTEPTLSVLSADWVSTDPQSTIEEGAVSVSPGFIDRDLDGDGVFNDADGVNVLRFHWNDMTLAGDPTEFFSFQAILFDLGGGDFDIEFNYGFGSSYNVGIQSITGAGITTPYTGTQPFSDSTDYFFSFTGGSLGVGVTDPTDPMPVPEPGPLWLLALAGSVLLWSAYYQRRRRQKPVRLSAVRHAQH